MPDFVRLCSKADLPEEGEAKEIPLGDKVICVANVSGTISAMDNVCLHRGGPLGQGEVYGTRVVCPWHGWEYDFAAGCNADDPGMKLACFAVRDDGNDVLVEL